MKSLPVLFLTFRLSLLSALGAGSVFIFSALRAPGIAFDGRTSAFHMAVGYGATLCALLLLARIRKTDVAKVVIGVFSLSELIIWVFTHRPWLADTSFAPWIAGLCGVTVAMLPFYVEEGRRSQRQHRRVGDAIARAQSHSRSHSTSAHAE